MHTFDIYFSGQLMPGADPQQAREAVGQLFKLQGQALERLFSGTPVRIKKAVDVEKANRYRAAFRDAGALIDIVPHEQQPPQPASAATEPPPTPTPEPIPVAEPDDTLGMTLLPPRTGSLEDCAPTIEPTPIPDTNWMHLDNPGVQLDETPAPPPLELDTSDMDMSPPNSGSLEDCVEKRPTRPIPDISHLAFADSGEPESES